ncbi:MAG: ATP-binding cassette domain-containing protein [Bacteroidota bacterium]
MSTLLQIQNVYKSYDTQAILEDVSFEVASGELVALVGESGVGKTTLLKLIAGLIAPDQGAVLLEGKPVIPLAGRRLAGHPNIKMVFQEPQLFPHHTIRENILHPIRHYCKADQEARLAFLLALGRLENVVDRLPKMLSGGQRQRVGMAVALADSPQVLLLDEPFNQLDTLLKQQISSELLALIRSTGMTSLFVTHELEEALDIADKIGILHQGKLLQLADRHTLLQSPKNAYVKRLLQPFQTRLYIQIDPSINLTIDKALSSNATFVSQAKASTAHYHLLITKQLDAAYTTTPLFQSTKQFAVKAAIPFIVCSNTCTLSTQEMIGLGIDLHVPFVENTTNQLTHFLHFVEKMNNKDILTL